MPKNAPETPIKKTVVMHPLMDAYVRKIWAILIEEGYDASYSMALNFLLLIAVMEATKKEGLSQKARDTVWAFANDQEKMDKLNLHDHVARLRELLGATRRGG